MRAAARKWRALRRIRQIVPARGADNSAENPRITMRDRLSAEQCGSSLSRSPSPALAPSRSRAPSSRSFFIISPRKRTKSRRALRERARPHYADLVSCAFHAVLHLRPPRERGTFVRRSLPPFLFFFSLRARDAAVLGRAAIAPPHLGCVSSRCPERALLS